MSTLTEPQAVGQAFNIGNPRSTLTIYNLAQQIVRLAKSESDLVIQPIDRTDVELRIPNIEKAASLLGFEPKVNLEEGLLRTIAWYRSQL